MNDKSQERLNKSIRTGLLFCAFFFIVFGGLGDLNDGIVINPALGITPNTLSYGSSPNAFKWKRYLLGFIFLSASITLIRVVYESHKEMVELREKVNQLWTNIEDEYEKKNNLILGLTEITKNYAMFEANFYKEIATVHQNMVQLKGSDVVDNSDKFQQYNSLQTSFNLYGQRVITAISYPQLKSHELFVSLYNQISQSENMLMIEKRAYNESVFGYNKFISDGLNSFLLILSKKSTVRPYFQLSQGEHKTLKK